LQVCSECPDTRALGFADELFENPTLDWVHMEIDEHFRQRHLREDHPIYCETQMTVHGAGVMDEAIDLISGPWDWWEHGHIADFTRNDDGSSDQILSPVWWFMTRVSLHMLPLEHLPDLHGWRAPMLLGRHFAGPSSMDVYPGKRSGDVIIRGRFHGVDYRVPLVPARVAEILHLDAEAGTMPTPFPKGTGWVGLLHRLEAR
jgi:hypothetical protein